MPCPEKLRESLEAFDVPADSIKEIFDGYEGIGTKSRKPEKAAFFKRALDIMDEKLPHGLTVRVMESGACCKSGARERASKEFVRINAGLPLEDKLAKIRRAPYMNMGSPELDGDGRLIIHAVSYEKDGKYQCACSSFNRVRRDYPVSRSYCCCGGHFGYHYEIMLGLKLGMPEVAGSPLDTDGAQPCVFAFDMIKE